MATAEKTLDRYQKEQVRLKRQLADLQGLRLQALGQGVQSTIDSLDANIALTTRALDEIRRYLAHHPDA